MKKNKINFPETAVIKLKKKKKNELKKFQN